MEQKFAPADDIKVASRHRLKEANALLIFQLIYKHGPISRADLAKMTMLSPTTVSTLADDMIGQDLIRETGTGSSSTSGRKPIMLDVHPRSRFTVSAELLDNGFSCYVCDIRCKPVAGGKFTVQGSTSIGDEIAMVIKSLLKAVKIRSSKLLGICISVPGLIDYENNQVVSSTAIRLDGQADMFRPVKEKYKGIPFILENESNLCAYAEMAFGAVGSRRNLVYIDYVGNGIGGGVVLDGQVYRGAGGISGEVGHISVDLNGPRCKCGSNGCLEVVAGIPAIRQAFISGIGSGRETIVNNIVSGDFNRITMDVVRTASDRQDALTLEILDGIAGKLAYGINNIMNLFNPQLVIIGGDICQVGDKFLDSVRGTLSRIMLKPNVGKIEVRYTELGDNAAILGGARFILDNRFSMPGLQML